MRIAASAFDSVYASYFKNIYSKCTLEISISRVLNGIRSDYFKDKVLLIRNLLEEGKKEEASQIKTSLHAVTFCGLFPENRRADSCSFYNNLMVIDIDKLQLPKFEEIRQILAYDKYIACFWISPSGKGYKGLVHLSYDDSTKDFSNIEKHKIAFRSLFKYLLSNYGIELDTSGSDITRLCFMGWDKNLVLKPEAEQFLVTNEEKNESADKTSSAPHIITDEKRIKVNWNIIYGESKGYKDHQYYRFKLNNIYKKLYKRKLSITDSYENWVKVAFAIASNIHPEKGRELFLMLCELDGVKHDAVKSENLIFNAYLYNKGLVNFSTIIYLARQKGLEVN